MSERRQVVDLPPVPAPVITEYQLLSKTCTCCGAVTTADWTGADDVNAQVVAPAGSPVRIGPRALAMCALSTCGHYLPVGRATALLETLTELHLAIGFTARARHRAAKNLIATFLPHMKDLLATAPMLHADETTGRAAGALDYVHVACTECLTLLHVGGRSSQDIDNGGVLKDFTGVLVRDGYAGYDHLPAVHAWCGAHYAEAGILRKGPAGLRSARRPWYRCCRASCLHQHVVPSVHRRSSSGRVRWPTAWGQLPGALLTQ